MGGERQNHMGGRTATRAGSLKGVKVALESKPWKLAKKAIGDGLDAYNKAKVEALGVKYKDSQFIAGARNGKGELIGGFWCYVYFDTCFLKWAWVGEAARGKDVGSKLMAQCEDEARKRGATVMFLDTFSFQARPFYEKLGFKTFGTLKHGAGGIKRHWMAKAL